MADEMSRPLPNTNVGSRVSKSLTERVHVGAPAQVELKGKTRVRMAGKGASGLLHATSPQMRQAPLRRERHYLAVSANRVPRESHREGLGEAMQSWSQFIWLPSPAAMGSFMEAMEPMDPSLAPAKPGDPSMSGLDASLPM
ncbi:hypothetical protein CYMTET_32942 [Cymbomonas tetramitiformis]|uniref:Uncharacterized protein n=1 Tax=Cymbomonas tetramitiformis TaxID=36881 RepID=A0AAE0FEQ2_9CHLO|nr:hypothetical protein CYMTET_32942 [Cymbomonas tetramitiformis]